jgi:hypothetical protein
MNLADEILAVPPGRKPNQCKTCFMFAEEDPKLREALNAALAGGADLVKLVATLTRNGYDVTTENLSRHHKKGHTL